MDTIYAFFRRIMMIFGLVLLLATAALVAARREPAETSWTIFSSLTDNTDYELHRMLPDGRVMKRLTYLQGNHYVPGWYMDGPNYGATWSPDNRWLYIRSQSSGLLYRMSATGGIIEQVAPYPAYFQTWMPDGERLMIAMNGDLYVMKSDGSDLNVLVETAQDDYFDTWSPDYEWFTFISSPDLNSVNHPYYSVYRANRDGTELIQFSTGSVERPYVMGWTPDNEWLVIWDYLAGGSPVDTQFMYRIRPDGTDLDYLELTSDGIDIVIGERAVSRKLVRHYFIGPNPADAENRLALLSDIRYINTKTNETVSLTSPRQYTHLSVLGWTDNREWVILLFQQPNLPDLYRLRYDGEIMELITVPSCWEFYGWSADHEWIYCGFSGTYKVHARNGETHRIYEGYIRAPQFYDPQSLYPIDLNWHPARLLIFAAITTLLAFRPRRKATLPPIHTSQSY